MNSEWFDYEDGCLLSMRCYGRDKWSVTIYNGGIIHTYWFKNPKSAYLFALGQTGLYSEWDEDIY